MKLPQLTPETQLPTTERWSDVAKTFGYSNPHRARQVADKIIGFGIRSVLDIGCGNMKLRDYLAPKGIGYMPADVVQRSSDCLVVDLNTDPVPRCDAECVVMVGVTEFLNDIEPVLADVAGHYDRILLTLSPLQTIYEQVWHGKPHTIACNHAAAYSLSCFKRLMARFFLIEDIDVISTGQYLLLGRARRTLDRDAAAAAEEDGGAGPGIANNVIDFDQMAGGGSKPISSNPSPFTACSCARPRWSRPPSCGPARSASTSDARRAASPVCCADNWRPRFRSKFSASTRRRR